MSPINRDLSDVDRPAGEPPSHEATLLLLPLAEAWYDDYLAGGNDKRAFAVEGTRFRASWAAGCARALGYKIARNDAERLADMLSLQGEDADKDALADAALTAAALQPTNPPGLADAWRMGLGQLVHERFQAVFEKAYPDAECEISVDLRPDIDGSASIDIVLREPHPDALNDDDRQGVPTGTFTTVIELKTINGFGFKVSTTNFKGAPEGPRFGAKVQAALSAKAIGADRMIVGYLSMECLSPDLAKGLGVGEAGRFLAAWSYAPDEFLPWAEAEHRRVAKVIEFVDRNELPPRAISDGEVPKAARITDPSKGMWTVADSDGKVLSAGKTWWCGYCWDQDRCIRDGESGVLVSISTK